VNFTPQGFPTEKADGADQVLIFATGSGISPIKAVIESGALKGTGRSKGCRLYWGTRGPGARAGRGVERGCRI
jgi:hypothetical protein